MRLSISIITAFLIISYCVTPTDAQTTAFTYQGSITSSGLPANGAYDFEFALYGSPSGGTQIGPTNTQSNRAVSNGLFMLLLDFGNQFDGSLRFLEVHVRPTGVGAFTILNPRQEITSVPYAVNSLTAQNADNAINSQQLAGVAANQYTLTSDPRLSDARPPTAGSSNYIQNAIGFQANSNFNISGTGVAGVLLTANTVNANNAFNLGQSRVLTATPASTSVGISAGATSPGLRNSFFGGAAGANNPSGNDNSFFGYAGGGSGSSGSQNSFFGSTAGQNTSTSNNTFFGFGAGLLNTNGFSNTAIGASANFGVSNLANATAIGANSRVDVSNALVLGSVNGINGATANTSVGIGTTIPGTTLDVQSNNASSIIRAKSSVSSSVLYLDRASAIAANGAWVAFNTAGSADFALGTSQGSAGISDFSIYNYGTASNAFTIQKSNNNVGVGTFSPSTALEVRRDGTPSSDWQTSQLRISGATDPNKQINLGFDTTTNAGVIQAGQAFTGFKPLYLNPAGGAVIFGGATVIPPTGNMSTSGLTIGTGGLQIINLTGGGGGSPLCAAGSAPFTVGFCSSSYRYKTNLSNYRAGLNVISRLNPIGYDWKQGGSHDIGLGAEDVEKIDKRLVFYNGKGEVEGVRYDRIGVVLVNAVKEQQEQIEKQDKKIQNLEEQVNLLRALLCKSNSSEKICRQ